MRIDTSGNVGIGTNSPGARLQVDDGSGRNLQIAPSGSGIDIISTTNPMRLITSDASNMTFSTNGSSNEAMRIDTSQNLMVGRTSLGISNTGHTLAAAGYVEFTRDGAAALNVGRNSSFGDTAVFWKDGVEQGRIASENGYLRIEGGNGSSLGSGLLFTNEVLSPRDAAGSSSDGELTLGESSARFKDAHFSGNVDCGEITYDRFDSSAGNSGLNVNAKYSYDDNSENSIGSNFHSNHTFIYISTNAGITVIPALGNGGAGIAWAVYLWNPSNQNWTSVNDTTFTQAGTSGNTFRIRIAAGTGVGTIERTSGSMAYQVYVSRPAGGS
tara:strand:- start:97 stop:1077 length:981 start_codon:yes stop_codon:yes gene_type:complete